MVAGYLMLNKDVVLALVSSIVLSAVVADALSDQEHYLNSTYSLIAGYVVYYVVFSTLYCIDNRREYRLESGRIDTARLKTDLMKIVLSFGVGEVAFAVVKWVGQYYLLTLGYEAYIASILAQIAAAATLLAVVNLTAKKARLYK